jgi:hypothetical protein
MSSTSIEENIISNITTLLEDFDGRLSSAVEKKFGGFPDELEEKNREAMDLMKNDLTTAKLQEEIKAQKQLIENLAKSPQSNEEGKGGGVTPQKNFCGKHYMMLAEQLNILYAMYEKLYLAVERMRMDNLVRKHEELHPLNKEVCPLCLEDIPLTSLQSAIYLVCCGNFTCFQCFQAACAGGKLRMKKCPCCRGELFINEKKRASLIEHQAHKGRKWAQATMGIYLLDGDAVHHEVDVKKALEWLNLAAEQRQPDAICTIAQLHAGVYGEVKEVEQCQIKARALMKEAADLGNLRAQRNYAMMCRLGQGGPVDKSEAAYYYTLVYSQKGLSFEKDEISPLDISDESPEEVLHAGLYLGIYHYYGKGGFTKNRHVAKYYLEEHVKESEKQGSYIGSDAYMYLAACLMELHKHRFFADFNIPGYSPVPRAMSLYRKSVKLGINHPDEASQHSKGILEFLDTCLKSSCGNCGVDAKDIPEGKLKACERCRSAWYCGKECQTKHWKAGHKTDCVR